MGWRSRVPRAYSKPHVKVMVILQNHGIRYETEKEYFLSMKRGDLVVADVVLLEPDPVVRVECDDPFFKPDMDEYLENDERLFDQYGIETVRLLNRKIMLKSGKAYVLAELNKWVSQL